MNSVMSSDRTRSILTIGLIFGLLGAVVVLAPRASIKYLVLLGAGLGGLLLLNRPQWGLVLLIPASLCVPFALGTGTQTEIPITVFLLIALLGLWVWTMYRNHRFQLVASLANWPLVALVVVAGLSIVAGQAMWNPLVGTKSNFLFVQLAQWAIFGLSAGAFWLTANLIRDTRGLKWMVGSFLVLGAAYVGLCILPGGWKLLNRAYIAAFTNSLFWVWLVALAWGQALFNRRLRWPLRLALLVLVAMTLYVAWFQARDWVSGWAPALVALLVILWLRSPLWGGVASAGMVAGIQTFYSYFYQSVVMRALNTGSFLRVDAWRGIVQLVGKRWPIGLGLAAYWHYWRALIGSWAYSSVNVTYNPEVNSHSNYVDIFAQMGVVGLVVFLWLAVALWRQGWDARRQVADGFERGYTYAYLGGVAGMLAAAFLSDWVLPFVYNAGYTTFRMSSLFWLFLGGQVVICSLARKDDRDTTAGKNPSK